MTKDDILALADKVEKAAADQEWGMIEEAASVIGEGWNASQHRRFARLNECRAFESAAIMLVPEGWNWMAGERDQGRPRAYVNNGQPHLTGIAARKNPAQIWHEVTAATPALALTSASLRAIAEMVGADV